MARNTYISPEVVDQYFTAALQGICANTEEIGNMTDDYTYEALASYAKIVALYALKQREELLSEANQQDTNDARSAQNECHVNTRARNYLASI
jgi:hypothetical protein